MSTYRIRIAQGRGDHPYPVDLVLPPAGRTGEAQQREEGKFYIIDAMPKDTAHHTTLGAFLDDWGALELTLTALLQTLLKTDFEAAKFVFAKLGLRQSADMIESLATLRLNGDGINAVRNLRERFSKLSSKRNILVHGHWCLELFIWPWKGAMLMRPHLLREIDPDDNRIKGRIADPRNQKERVKYTFTLRRISATARDAINLRRDLGELIKAIEAGTFAKDSS